MRIGVLIFARRVDHHRMANCRRWLPAMDNKLDSARQEIGVRGGASQALMRRNGIQRDNKFAIALFRFCAGLFYDLGPARDFCLDKVAESGWCSAGGFCAL